MVCTPSVNVLVVNPAWPLPFSATFEASKVTPLVNVTVPVVTGLPLLVTVAVNVTLLPVRDGFSEDCTVVVVDTAAAVVMFRSQPPVIDERSPRQSSVRYKF